MGLLSNRSIQWHEDFFKMAYKMTILYFRKDLNFIALFLFKITERLTFALQTGYNYYQLMVYLVIYFTTLVWL